MNINRRIIKADKRKEQVQESQNDASGQLIYCLKRKNDFVNSDNIYLRNEEEIMNFYKQRKHIQVGINELIRQTEQLSLVDDKVVILKKMNEEQVALFTKREYFANSLRKQQLEKIFNQNRCKNREQFVHLENDNGTLYCKNMDSLKRQQYEQEEVDFYQMETVKRDQLKQENNCTNFNLNVLNLEKYLHYNQYEQNDLMEDDSDDSWRTDNSKFDYPDKESDDNNENADDNIYNKKGMFNDSDQYGDDDSRRSSNSYEEREYEKQDIEMDEEEEQIQSIDKGKDFLNFLQLHHQYQAQKQDWRSFNYNEDF